MKTFSKYIFMRLVIILVLMTVLMSFSKTDWPFYNVLLDKFSNLRTTFSEERIYLHTDKTLYKPGETIWFKTYVVNSENKYTQQSDVVYVELVDPKGSVAEKLTLQLNEGCTNSGFKIGSEQNGGLYKLRAYTQWMRNFGEEIYFKKDIVIQKIIQPSLLLKLDYLKKTFSPGDSVKADFILKDLNNVPISTNVILTYNQEGNVVLRDTILTDKKGTARISFPISSSLNSRDAILNLLVNYQGKKESISRSVPILLNKIDLQFLPEGGHYIHGVESFIAFKAINEFGKPAELSGHIIDQKGSIIKTFSSFHDGMGGFNFKPEKGISYKVKITNPSVTDTTYFLPRPKDQGFVLNVEESIDTTKIKFKIYSSFDTQLHLVAHSNEYIYDEQVIDAGNGWNFTEINKSVLRAGINQITLFDSEGNPLCERIIFNDIGNNARVTMKTDKDIYLPGEKVKVIIETKGGNDTPLPAMLSLSVVNNKNLYLADDKQDHITSYLLMSSELTGKVEEPGFYFDVTKSKAKKAMDFVMLTNGWRRFNWDGLMNQDFDIKYPAERTGVISGVLVRKKDNETFESEVYLFELGNKRRLGQMATNNDGTFTFENVDPSVSIQLFGKPKGLRSGRLFEFVMDKYWTKEYPSEEDTKFSNINVKVPETIKLGEKKGQENSEVNKSKSSSSTINAQLSPDVQQLSEVVVTAVGVEREKKSLGYAVERIESDNDFSNVLNGQVAGVQITKSNNLYGSSTNGFGLNSKTKPLYIVDGVPLSSNHLNSFSPLGFLTPEDIDEITLMNSSEMAIGANGIIFVTTKKRDYFRGYHNSKGKNKYASKYISPRKLTNQVEYYQPNFTDGENENLIESNPTVYWNPNINTNEHGITEVTFNSHKELSSYNITVEGISGSGKILRGELNYSVEKPFSITAKLPEYLMLEDTLNLPVVISNKSDSEIEGKIDFQETNNFKLLSENISSLKLKPGEVKVFNLDIAIQGNEGIEILKIDFITDDFTESLQKSVEINRIGFPSIFSVSSTTSKKFSFEIPDPIKGSARASLKFFPNTYADITEGLGSILRKPYGCFEQTSASTFPNVIVLQLMKETGVQNDALYAQAQEYIHAGYKKLIAFETTKGGFEWFGDTPPHEGLTAYGLLEFLEMKEVYDQVSEELIQRTAKWLLSRKNEKGGFDQSRGKYGFSAASEEVNNAYILYALTRFGETDLEKQFEMSYNEAMKSEDSYRMALVALSAHYLGRWNEYNELMDKLKNDIRKKDWGNLQADHSIVRSYGKSLQIEVASLIILAETLKDVTDFEFVRRGIHYIKSNRQNWGGFGSTQSTIQALQALKEYAVLMKSSSKDKNVELLINGEVVAKKTIRADQVNAIEIDSLGKYLGLYNSISVSLNRDTIPFTFSSNWTSYKPQTSSASVLRLGTHLSQKEIKLGETVRLSVNISNKKSEGVPMSIAIIGIPSGLTVQTWQLKQLLEEGVYDFYEINDNYLILYYRELGPKANMNINFDLKGEIPGSYNGPASSAYLYYSEEDKYWEKGLKIRIDD